MRPQQRFRTPEDDDEQVIHRREGNIAHRRSVPVAYLVVFGLTCVYAALFLQSLQGRWFDARWTTDDALQQSFLFHEVYSPGVFGPDLISEMMRHYVSPLHYWLGMGLTYFTQDPLMTGHWIMLIQVAVAGLFVFLTVYRQGGLIPACFSFSWLLLSRNTMQRITGGLQRGWAPALLALFLYLLMGKKHRSILVLLCVSWLLHSPSALLMTATYGVWLCWKTVKVDSRLEFRKPFFNFIFSLPILGVLAVYGSHKPENLGKMVSYSEAQSMPEFGGQNGRFQMVPLPDAWQEIKDVGFQSFNSTLTKGTPLAEEYLPTIVIGLAALIVLIGMKYRKVIFGAEGSAFLICILGTYFASRIFAFHLFVPNRYLQIPMTIFFVVFLPIAVWRIAEIGMRQASLGNSAKGTLGLGILGALIFWGSGLNLVGDANFNMPKFVRGNLWSWVADELPKDAVIAGYPAHIDGVQLFGKRQGYVTNEVAHPFYDKYYQEMKRRLEISLRAHFAKDAKAFLALLEPEGITHFVFNRKIFYPENLAEAKYFAPFDVLVKELAAGRPESYFYKRLPRDMSNPKFGFLVYKDDQSAVVDIKALKEFVSKGGRFPA